jgi:16S rRNA (adenine1518-N6/adenine1519-N6)-dimethyltransferase
MNLKLIPKKSLGQNFLRSEKAIKDILGTISEIDKNILIIEIGGGEGVLTKKILELGFAVCVIEIDKEAAEKIKFDLAEYIKSGKLKIIQKDVLQTDFAEISENKTYCVLGNIPYYITGLIFRHIFSQKIIPNKTTLMVQKEVAQRAVAKDGKLSLMSLSLQIYGEVKLISVVKKGSFFPVPKVDSAIICISENRKIEKDKEEDFFKLIHAGFSHPRKYVLNNIKKELGEESFLYLKAKENIPEKQRAEDVPLSVWVKIVNLF